jgi:hypothetical protein
MNQVLSQNTNPFGSNALSVQPESSASSQAYQTGAVAEVQAVMLMAKMYPRDPIASMDRILNACTRPTLADTALYSYARGGSNISGPSIRLAEAIAQQWGNLKFGIQELDQREGVSTVRAYARDLETTIEKEAVFQVKHIRNTKRGSYKLEDPRDIYETIANQGARRLRACILAVIPGDVTEAAVAQCEVTMSAKADTSADAMQKMLVAFEAFGVTKEQIEKRIQRRIDAIQSAQVVSLKKIYASLRDGMSVASDWFEASSDVARESSTIQKTGIEAVKATLKQKLSADAMGGETSPDHRVTHAG